MIFNETFTLNNGVRIPKLALGTWFIDDDKAAEALRQAIKIGYRHIDTAQAYGNERGVGEGVRTCGAPREELFVVSKVAAEHKDYDSAMKSIDETLAKMGLDYLDMMIIHSPQPWMEVNQSETVVLLSRKMPDDKIEVDLDLDELDITSAESKATYQEIKEYVHKEFGLKVSTLYISQVKRKCGIIERENYNHSRKDNCHVPQCPKNKENAIRAALEHFGMI